MALNAGAANQVAYIFSLGENGEVTDNVKGSKNRKNFCLFGLNLSKTGLIDLFWRQGEVNITSIFRVMAQASILEKLVSGGQVSRDWFFERPGE